MIAQAIMEQCIIAREPGCPCSHPPVTLSFMFHSRDESPPEKRFHSTDKLIEEPGHIHWLSHHDWGRVHNMAITAAIINETSGWHSPELIHLHWIVDLRVIGVQYQHPHWCHQGPIDWDAPGDSTMANAMGNWEAP